MSEQSPDFIPCVLIPLQQHYVLIPNTTVAEVIPLPRITPADNKPNYWVGLYQWQSMPLPVIDLDSLIEESDSHCSDANKLCIFRGINPHTQLENYALPCYGAPQLIHLNESALKLANTTLNSEYVHCQIQIGNKLAYIPNLDAIEATINQ